MIVDCRVVFATENFGVSPNFFVSLFGLISNFFEGFPNGIVTIMNYDSLDQLVISRNIRFHFITISQVEFQHLRIIKVFYNQKLFN